MKKQVLLTAAVLTATSMTAQKLKYPKAPKDGTIDTYFGVQVADPYRPLENDSSKATAEWVAAENKVTQDYLARIPFRGKLLKRMKELANYEKVSSLLSSRLLANGFSIRTTACRTRVYFI